jgi:FixJ family two-component response regulator
MLLVDSRVHFQTARFLAHPLLCFLSNQLIHHWRTSAEGGCSMNTLHEYTATDLQIPPHILVMEDEINIAKGLEMVLSEEGYNVDIAMTGKAALNSFINDRFDLLLADLRLPDINGMDVIRDVKTNWPKTGVIVITGYGSVPSVVDAMKLGSYDYLPKPFTEDEIKAAVDGALKGKQSATSEEIIQKVKTREEEKLIQKQEVLRVLDRTVSDETFWRDLIENGSEALDDYQLNWEAKAALASGDLNWIEKNIGKMSRKQLLIISKRLEREAW